MYRYTMRVLGLEQLSDFMEKHANARPRLRAWLAEAREAQWATPADLRARYDGVKYVKGHYIFKIGGNRYRLDTRIDFATKIVLILRIGTHEQYDSWSFN